MTGLVLVVDDHTQNRRVLSRRLERRGYEVAQAGDGGEAVEMAKSLLPDCILMDLSMPTVSGFAALEQIRANPQTASIPAIALTAHAMEDVRVRCMESGFEAFRTKPLDFQDLLECMGGLLAGKTQSSGPEAASNP